MKKAKSEGLRYMKKRAGKSTASAVDCVAGTKKVRGPEPIAGVCEAVCGSFIGS